MTSLHAAHGYPADGPMVPAMLKQTVSEAATMASGVSVEEMFDRRRIRRQGSIAASLAVSVLLLGVTAPHVVQRWWRAFVECAPTYHQRTTHLDVAVIAQPGDRRVAFRRFPQEHRYLHPRGQDLNLEITVPEGGPAEDQPWIVPDRVQVDVIRGDGSRSRSFVSATGERTFRFVLTRLNDDVRIELQGGDFRTPVPYHVACVTPPGIDALQLECDYPAYTGWNQLRETTVHVLGSEVSLPVLTDFRLQATVNKPLQSVRIVTDWFELTGDSEATRIRPRDGFAVGRATTGPLLDAEGTHIHADFEIVPAAPASPARSASADATTESASEPPTDSPSEADRHPALPLLSNSSLRFFLHDTDGILSTTPEVLRIRGIADQPPSVITALEGVGNAVTRRARIPVSGSVTDDYGIASAGFEFLVDDETAWRPRPFRGPPQPGTTSFELRRSPSESVEIFELQSLGLSEGQSLTLSVVARDLNNLTGPGVSRGDPVVLRVVSNEELLSLLYTREINLRRRFEDVIDELTSVRDDLRFHRDLAARLDTGDPQVIQADDAAAVNTCASRSSNTLRRQQNELRAIADGFDEIVRQLINNAIPPQTLAETMRDGILRPLQRAADESLATTDRRLSAFRLAALQGEPSEQPLVAAADNLDTVIAELRTILEQVRDMAEFHEALRDLKSILEEQERLLEETRQMQKRNLIDKLKLLE